jgi:hypothetical protein
MSGKQMEGDNQRRRTLARQTRERGRRPSETGVTLGASKQFEHVDDKYRAGPPPAGEHKGELTKGPPPPSPTETFRPTAEPDRVGARSAGAPPVVRYRDLVAGVRSRTGADFDEARTGAEATVVALAHALREGDRQRLLETVPAELHDDHPVGNFESGNPAVAELPGFLAEVARLAGCPPERARYQAQATLTALAEQDRDLVDSLDIPTDIRELVAPPPAGGGVVDPATGHTPPLSDDDLRAALARLPYWSGTREGLSRSISLPRENLDRVLRRLERLKPDTGRAPLIGRQDASTAVVVVRTGSVDAVTALDVDLANRVDAAIDEVGAGMAAG